MLAVIIWWLILQVIGLLALPITLRLLRFLPDRGVGFARPIGLLLAGYLFWVLVTFGILQNTTAGIVVTLLALGVFSALLWAREGTAMLAQLRERKRIIIAGEVLFFLAFCGFAFFRAYHPDISGTEKPMEFAFINGILRSRTFPPRDPWLSGYSISYYYFGYLMVAMLTRLSGLLSDITFNLTVAMLFALTVSGAFSLVCNLVQGYLDRRAQVRSRAGEVVSRSSILTGLLGSIFVAVMGNLEGVFELMRAKGLGSEALWRWLDVKNLTATPPSSVWYPTDGWWWWRASRVIHDRDALGKSMEVIDEFPFFSFLLGDNHPHVLALPFVLLAIALALNLLFSRHEKPASAQNRGRGLMAQGLALLNSLWAYGPFDLVLWALLLGGLGFLNTWDYPIYLGLFVLVYGLHRWSICGRLDWTWLGDVVALGAWLAGLGILLYFPFYLGFRSQAGGIALVGTIKTRLHQYLLMLGPFVFLVIGLLVAVVARWARSPSTERRIQPLAHGVGGLLFLLFLLGQVAVLVAALARGWWTAALSVALVGVAALLLFWGSAPVDKGGERDTRLEASTLFALLIASIALILTLSVEFIYLRDTFGSRMNTVFKFYYQAWVLLALASAYGVFLVSERLAAGRGMARIGLVAWGVGAVILVAAGLSYTVAAGVSKANAFQGKPTLDGARYIAQYRRDDYDAVQWLRQNASADAVMLEATGGQYTEYNWISAHTGIPTVLGWAGHELQWRGNYDEPGKREQDIPAIYQGLEPNRVLALLDKYGVDYVYVGRLERDKYRLSQAMIRKFERIMVRVYEQGGVVIYARSR